MASNELISNTLKNIISDIAHKIRTPLSTVINDLSYFAHQLGEEEVERPLGACKKISALLDSLTESFPKLEFEKVSIHELHPELDADGKILVDRKTFKSALRAFCGTVAIATKENELLLSISDLKLEPTPELSQAFITLVSHGQVLIKNQLLTVRIPFCDE